MTAEQQAATPTAGGAFGLVAQLPGALRRIAPGQWTSLRFTGDALFTDAAEISDVLAAYSQRRTAAL